MNCFGSFNDVVRKDEFLSMSKSAQCLYFQMVVEADANGIIVNPKTLIRTVDATEEDLKQLEKSGFVYSLSKWVVIRDWNKLSKAKQS